MKRFVITLLSVLSVAIVSPALARTTKKTYSGTYKGQPCTVQINWHNWEGLGPIDGVIRVASGASVPFSGTNSQPGVIELTAAGESFRLVRKDVGKAASWSSPQFFFSEAPTPTPSPTPSPGPEEVLIPEEQMPPSRMVDETYAGSWRGQQFTARIRWAPGDNPQIIRRGLGTITLPGGQKFSIEGTQSSAEAAEFSIKADASRETHKTTKTTRDGNESWESSTLTLTQTK